MSAITFWAAIASISAVVVVVTSIFASSRAAATSNRQSMKSVQPDPQAREHGQAEGGPDYARVTQLVALAVLIVAVIALIIVWI